MREDPPPREALLRLALAFPGIRAGSLARLAGMSTPVARYHLRRLEREGLVVEHASTHHVRVFPAQGRLDEADRRLLALVREPGPLALVLALLVKGPQAIPALSTLLQVPRSSLRYHLAILQGEGILDIRERQATLVEPKRVRALLRACPPTEDELGPHAPLWEIVE